ncbi:hypothetical protein UMM65_07400 [Aureibaculum sp. 2210JD6-5]|uniref:DUF6630 family protein n=1 Tax=Aureibaculum sp. 2210JD6-5 TaxID=3103957 RepID=UPI002AAD67C1|nr:hypothetical protein [Aureibaculum sp. 2210JD6-5]MDY7395062.1 hypothetical protein [Aureibaculum sp. 2210JD6-5]
MKRTLLSILTFTVFTYVAVAQATDYSKVIFSSKIYEYKNDEPRTQELGIDKDLLSNIVDNLGDSLYTEKERKDIVDKAWLAFSNPKLFDFVYKDFAVKTINNWGQVNAKGELVLEPNPYLTEWTINSDEFPYFQLALSKILSHYDLITYGDDAEGVQSSFNELLITKNINFQDPKDDDWAYSYLETINKELAPKGLVALVTKGYYNIIVCKVEKKEEITELFKKIEWDFIQP